MYDIIIIGAGPAGLTAAIYARRALKSVLVLEESVCGGQILNTFDIENYPAEPNISGPDLAKKMSEQAKNLGAKIVFEKALEIKDGATKIVKTEENEYEAKTIIIATGTKSRKLGLKNEDKFLGRGLSYCATCDGALFTGKKIAVAGGGSGALYEALYLADLAEKVYLIHRRGEFRGENGLVKALEEKGNIEFILNANVKSLIGGEKLEKIEVETSNGTKTIDLDGLFVAIGREPVIDFAKNLVETDENGFIKAGEDCKTSVEGIFVAGDTRTKSVRQIVTATSDGAIAAENAIKFLNA